MPERVKRFSKRQECIRSFQRGLPERLRMLEASKMKRDQRSRKLLRISKTRKSPGNRKAGAFQKIMRKTKEFSQIFKGANLNMNLYESIFIGRQNLSQQQVDALGVSLGLLVRQNSGEVVRNEYCGFRNLAYPIKKNQKGHYYILQLKASADCIHELENTMRLNEDIIRYLVVRVENFDEKDNLISQVKSFGEDYNKDYNQRNNNDANTQGAAAESKAEKAEEKATTESNEE